MKNFSLHNKSYFFFVVSFLFIQEKGTKKKQTSQGRSGGENEEEIKMNAFLLKKKLYK
jgi:hypothetical protein